MRGLDVEAARGRAGDDRAEAVGEPSPQSIVAVKSLAGAPVLASVKLPMIEAAGDALAGAGVQGGRRRGRQRGVADDGLTRAIATASVAVLVIVTVTA